MAPKFLSGVEQTYGRAIPQLEPLTLDPAAYKGALVAGQSGRLWVSDGLRWSLSVSQLPPAPNEITVGVGGDFPELQDAINHATSYIPPVSDDAFQPGLTIKLLSGYLPAVPVTVVGQNLGWLAVTSQDAVVNVPVSACGLVANPESGSVSYAFVSIYRGEAPTFRCTFRLINSTWTGDGTLTVDGKYCSGIRLQNVVAYLAGTGPTGTPPNAGGFQNFSVGITANNSVVTMSDYRCIDNRASNVSNSSGSVNINGGLYTGAQNWGVLTTKNGRTYLSAGADCRKVPGVDSPSDMHIAGGGILAVDATVIGGTTVLDMSNPRRGEVRDFRLTTPFIFGGTPQLPSFSVATAPVAADYARCLIYVTDGAAGQPVQAFSNGINWLRCDTLAVISAT